MIVDVDEAIRPDPGGRQQVLPDRKVVGRGGRTEVGGVPFDQQRGLPDQPGVVVARQGQIERQLMESRDQIDRGLVEQGLEAGVRDHPTEQLVAQIFQHNEARLSIGGQHLGRAQPLSSEPPRDLEERADIERRGRRIHQHHGTGTADQPLVAADRSIACERQSRGAAKAMPGEQARDGLLTQRHRGAPPAVLPSRGRPPGGRSGHPGPVPAPG